MTSAHTDIESILREAADLALNHGLDLSGFMGVSRMTIIKAAMAKVKGNGCAAARVLRVHRNTIGRMKHEIVER